MVIKSHMRQKYPWSCILIRLPFLHSRQVNLPSGRDVRPRHSRWNRRLQSPSHTTKPSPYTSQIYTQMYRITYNSIPVSLWETVKQRWIMSSTDLADGVSLAGAAVLTGQARVHRLCIWSVCICCCWTIKTLPKQTLCGKKRTSFSKCFMRRNQM